MPALAGIHVFHNSPAPKSKTWIPGLQAGHDDKTYAAVSARAAAAMTWADWTMSSITMYSSG